MTCISNETLSKNILIQNVFLWFDWINNIQNFVYCICFQTPACINSISLDKDSHYIVDLCASPAEPDQVALCKNNGAVMVISSLFDKNFKIVSKMVDAATSELIYFLLIKFKLFASKSNSFQVCWSHKGKSVVACTRQNKILTLNYSDLESSKCFDCPDSGLIGEIHLLNWSILWLIIKQICFFIFVEATNIGCVSNKQFTVGYAKLLDGEYKTLFTLNELITDKVIMWFSYRKLRDYY